MVTKQAASAQHTRSSGNHATSRSGTEAAQSSSWPASLERVFDVARASVDHGWLSLANDVAQRDLYKLSNSERAAAVARFIEATAPTQKGASAAGTAAWSSSGLRSLSRSATQLKLSPLGRLFSRLIEKDRSWPSITRDKGDPRGTTLSPERRLEIAKRIARSSGRTSKLMNAAQGVGKGTILLGALSSGVTIGQGINKIQSGKTGEGAVDIGEGATNLALSAGTYAGVKSGALVVAQGTGAATFSSGLAAAGGLALGFEESRRAVRGEKTMAAQAVEEWKDVQDRAADAGPGIGNALKYVGAGIAGSAASLIAGGQKDLWGLWGLLK